MVGSCLEDIGPGLMPTAIAWLFRGIGEQKNKTGARFSVRVSAVEIAGPAEVLRDLLAPHATGKLVALRAFLFIFILSPIIYCTPFWEKKVHMLRSEKNKIFSAKFHYEKKALIDQTRRVNTEL
jgi:hypothetical protein